MANITGTGGNDTITPGLVTPGALGGPVTTGADSIFGLAGNDVLDGGDGNDTLDGGAGNDSILGGAGRDTLLGGDGNDTLVAGSVGGFNDRLDGGNNADELRGRDVADPAGLNVFLIGGAGNDTILGYGLRYNLADYSANADGIAANLGTGTVTLGTETDTLVQVRGLRAGSGADSIIGSAFDDQILAGNGADSIDGGAGSDVISYVDAAAGVVVNLAIGRATDAGGAIDTILGFETVLGGDFNDSIVGNALDNRLEGLKGNDTLDGGGGYDTVRYSYFFNTTQTQGVVANLQTGTAVDAWGSTDTLLNIEAVTGTALNDDLTGINLASGDESNLRGLGGNDTLRAATVDTRVAVDYRDDPGAVRVNLSALAATLGGLSVSANTARDGFGGVDTLVNIQIAIGSNFNDTVLGSERADRLYGFAGNDSLIGGAGDDSLYGGQGTDTYSGGDGFDLVIFTPRNVAEVAGNQGVIASLATGLIANDGYGNAESMTGGTANDFEMLIGYNFADDLTGKDAGIDANGFLIRTYVRGNQGNDTLRAASAADRDNVATDYLRDIAGVTVNLATQTATDGWGNTDTLFNIGGARGSDFADSLTGGANDDWFRGQAGNDTIDGGGGTDNASYFSSTAAVVIDLAAGTATDGFGGTDTLISIEIASGGAAGDTLIGAAAAETLSGFGGADSLDGGDGNDSLRGGDDNDTLLGGNGVDTLRGEAGNDSLDGGSQGDSLLGGTGDDTYVFGAGDTIVELAAEGRDTVQSAVTYTLGNELEVLLLTGKKAINGTGNAQANALTGNSGVNLLNGLGSDDTLVGGSGNDTLIGGSGADQIDGGRGLDVFRYASAAEGGDAILAFSSDDAFEISAAGFGGGLFTGIDIAATGRFVSNKTGVATAGAGTGQLVFESDTGILRWDADGKGTGAAVILATIDGGNPTAADFVVVA